MPATHFSEADFTARVLKSDKPVLVDFYADWCGPCRVMAPVFDELASELDGKMVVGKVDVDANQALAEKYQVMSIPTTIVIKGGEVVERFSGVQPKGALLQKLHGLI
jgi:thioredoxin 1